MLALVLELALALVLVLVLELALELAAPELVLELALELVASELVIVTVAFAAILGEFGAPVAPVPSASQLPCYALAAYPVAQLEIADSLARRR